MILLILIGVLWAGTAGAEPSDKNTVWGGLLGNGQLIELDKPCNIGDAALTNRDRLIHCHGYGWTETQMMPTACEQKMQAAMEAMDEFVNPSTSYSTYDGCNTCTFANGGGMCTTLACTGRNEVALAEWELKKAKERAVVAERRQKAHEQWTEAKACWRKP